MKHHRTKHEDDQTYRLPIYYTSVVLSEDSVRHSQTLHVCHICLHWGSFGGQWGGIYGIHGVSGICASRPQGATGLGRQLVNSQEPFPEPTGRRPWCAWQAFLLFCFGGWPGGWVAPQGVWFRFLLDANEMRTRGCGVVQFHGVNSCKFFETHQDRSATWQLS